MACSKCCIVASCLLIIAVGTLVWYFTRLSCPSGSFSKAAVAADSEKCSTIGRDILNSGGSAVDGAIAALLCTSVVVPQSMGIGGGAIFTVMDSSGNVKIISSRETVPKMFKPDLLKACPEKFRFMTGPEWIGVPGEIRGYELAHRLYGKLPWASLFQPTIKLAREGLEVSPLLEKRILEIKNKLFSDSKGNPLKTGDIIKFEKLADTLEVIANHGAEAFYSGKIAEDLISDIQEAGGTLTLQDLASFRASQSDAWVFPFQDFEMYIPPPPAGGALLALVLNILKGYNLDAKALKLEEKTLTYHRYIEAFKFVNGLRKHIHDPNITSDKIAETLIQDSFADHIRNLISNTTHKDHYYNSNSYLDTMGTTHISVLAEDGSAVSVTSTINHIFGSQILSPKTGIILNNQVSDCCGRHEIHAGERPPSSASPAVLKSRTRTLVIGGSGGTMITTAIASTLMNRLWFGKSLKEAINSPLVFVDSHNNPEFEGEFDEKIIHGLIAFGHKKNTQETFYNVVNAVEKEGKCVYAVSDARRMGNAAGY